MNSFDGPRLVTQSFAIHFWLEIVIFFLVNLPYVCERLTGGHIAALEAPSGPWKGGVGVAVQNCDLLIVRGADAHFTYKFSIFFRGVVDPWTYIESTCTSSME